MDPIKEALTFDDVTLAPNYSEILPFETNTSTKLSNNLTLKIPLIHPDRATACRRNFDGIYSPFKLSCS